MQTLEDLSTKSHAFFTRWKRWFVAALILLVIGISAAVILIPRLVDVRLVVAMATKGVAESTGRTLSIKGPVTLRLWPRLGVVAEDVHLGNAPWAADTDMATVKRLALSLDWTPLLHETISINQVELDGLALNLQSGSKASGVAGNWMMAPATGAADSSSAFNLEKILLNDAIVVVRDEHGKLIDTFTLDNASGTFAGESIAFKGDVLWRQQAANLQGRFAYPDNKPSSLALAVSARTLDLSRWASASASTPAESSVSLHPKRAGQPWWQSNQPIDYSVLPQMNLQLDLKADQVQLANGVLLPNLNLSAGLDESGSGALTLQKFSIGFDQGQINVTGALNGFAGQTPSLVLKATANGFDLAKIFTAQKLELPQLSATGGAVRLDVDLAASGQSPRQLMATLKGYAQANIGAGSLSNVRDRQGNPFMIALQSFNGRADFQPGASPRLVLDLNASRINLDATQVVGAPVKAARPSENRRWLFGTDTLGFNALPLMNGNVSLNVTEMVLPDGIVLPNLLLKASLQDANGGTMKVDRFQSGFGGGVLMADGVISQYTSANPALRLRGHARSFRLDHLITQMDAAKNLGELKGGASEFAFHFEGQGTSPRTLVSNLNGEFQLSVSEATVPKSLMDATGDLVLRLLNTINPLRSSSPVSELHCAVAYLPVRNGLVSIDNSVATESNEINVLLNGQIDLKQEQVNINIQSAQKSGLTTGINPAGMVVVQGTLLNPSLGINKTGVVKQVAGVGLALVTSGISLAAQNLMSVATEKGPCKGILRPWSSIDGQLMSTEAQGVR